MIGIIAIAGRDALGFNSSSAPRKRLHMKNILVGTDLSERSRPALERALQLPVGPETKVTLQFNPASLTLVPIGD